MAASQRPSSTAGSKCSVPRIAQSFTSERSCHSASPKPPSGANPSIRAHRLSSADDINCACKPQISLTTWIICIRCRALHEVMPRNPPAARLRPGQLQSRFTCPRHSPSPHRPTNCDGASTRAPAFASGTAQSTKVDHCPRRGPRVSGEAPSRGFRSLNFLAYPWNLYPNLQFSYLSSVPLPTLPA